GFRGTWGRRPAGVRRPQAAVPARVRGRNPLARGRVGAAKCGIGPALAPTLRRQKDPWGGRSVEDRTKYGTFPGTRPRRLRTSRGMRRMVAETRLHPADFILPAFVREGISEPVQVAAMPGVVQHTRDSLKKTALAALEAGVSGIMLFGVPEDSKKDAVGT